LKSFSESYRILQAELGKENKEKNKEIKDDLPKKEEIKDDLLKKEENSDKNDNKNVNTTEAALKSLVEEHVKTDNDHDEDSEFLESDDTDDSGDEQEITYIDDFLILLNERVII